MQSRHSTFYPPMALALLMIAGVLGIQMLLSAFMAGWTQWMGAIPYPVQTLLNVGCELLLFGLPPMLYYRRHPEQNVSLRMQPLSLRAGGWIVLAAVVGNLALNLLIAIWSMVLERLGMGMVASPIPIPSTVPALCISWITVAIAPAVCEELLFRGMLLPAAESPLGTRRAILLSGCLFAFMHGSILGLPAHLLLGLVLGVLAVYTGSIWAPMLYHLCHNGLSMLIAYQVARFSPQAAEEEAVALTWGEAAQLLPAMLLLFALLALFLRFALRARHLKAYVDCRPRTGTFSVWIWTAICLLLAAMAAAYGMDGLAMMIEGGTIV